MSLSSKSAQEISEMLDDFGIKHGPVVDSTRSLYEKKLREAMSKGKPRTSSDKTYYREEEEEVTYIYRTPVRSELSADGPYKRSRPEWTNTEYEQELDLNHTPVTSRTSYLQSAPMNPSRDVPQAAKSSRFIPLWLQFFVFVAVAVLLYLVFSNMESNEYHRRIN